MTEEVTDIDIVSTQMRIASGESLDDIGIQPGESGASQRLRDPNAHHHRRPHERLLAGYGPDRCVSVARGRRRAPRRRNRDGRKLGYGHFDCDASSSSRAAVATSTRLCTARRRALAEFSHPRGHEQHPFLAAVLADRGFRAGGVTTAFIDKHPELLQVPRAARAARGTKLLTVPWPHHGEPPERRHADDIAQSVGKAARIDLHAPPPAGTRQLLLELGPEGLRQGAARARRPRHHRHDDARRPPIACSPRGCARSSLLKARRARVARMTPELFSVECWGGATYDVALRFLSEDPWHVSRAYVRPCRTSALQMLLRGRNTVGYTPYPDEVAVARSCRRQPRPASTFSASSTHSTMWRRCDPRSRPCAQLANRLPRWPCATRANMVSPDEDLYTLDYYLHLADSLVDAGAHILAIKDMAGLLRPRGRIYPGDLHCGAASTCLFTSHARHGGRSDRHPACCRGGGRRRGRRRERCPGRHHSQPSMSALVAAVAHTTRDTGVSLEAVRAGALLGGGTARVRTVRVWAPRTDGTRLPSRDPGRAAVQPAPASRDSGLGRIEAIEATYAAADRLLGRLVKVTPSSKVVGDLALALVGIGVSVDESTRDPSRYDIPDSVIGFLRGELGTPAGGWPEPFRTRALEGRTKTSPVATLSAEDEKGLDGTSVAAQNAGPLYFPGTDERVSGTP